MKIHKHIFVLISKGYSNGTTGFISPIFYCKSCKNYYKQNRDDDLEPIVIYEYNHKIRRILK